MAWSASQRQVYSCTRQEESSPSRGYNPHSELPTYLLHPHDTPSCEACRQGHRAQAWVVVKPILPIGSLSEHV